MSNRFLLELANKHDITVKRVDACMALYNSIRSNRSCPWRGDSWNNIGSRRTLTRIFYEITWNYKTGFFTPNALKVKHSTTLTTKQKNEQSTSDHVLSGQAYGTFAIGTFDKDEDPDLALDKLIHHVKTASQTIECTHRENIEFKKITENNESTGGKLKIKVPADKRYEACGITKLWDDNNGRYIEGCPILLSDEFLEFQSKELLI